MLDNFNTLSPKLLFGETREASPRTAPTGASGTRKSSTKIAFSGATCVISRGPDRSGVVKVFRRAADLRQIADPQKSYETRMTFNILRLLVRFPTSKYAILTDEIRYSAHRRKVPNLLHSFRASIGPKSKNRIFNILRQYKYEVVNVAPGKPWL